MLAAVYARADTGHRDIARCHRLCLRYETFGFAGPCRVSDLADELLLDFDNFEFFYRITIRIATHHGCR